jgi:hypothetical protein
MSSEKILPPTTMPDAPAVHIRREYERPPSLRSILRKYIPLVEHYANHGKDPMREARRVALTKHGPVRLSPIAWTEGPLPFGRIEIDKRRRVWRFRAVDPASGRCIYSRFVEGETREEGCKVGAEMMTREWDVVLRNSPNGMPPAAVVASVLAI